MAKSKNPMGNGPVTSGTTCNPPHPGMPEAKPKESPFATPEPKVEKPKKLSKGQGGSC